MSIEKDLHSMAKSLEGILSLMKDKYKSVSITKEEFKEETTVIPIPPSPPIPKPPLEKPLTIDELNEKLVDESDRLNGQMVLIENVIKKYGSGEASISKLDPKHFNNVLRDVRSIESKVLI